MKRCPLKLVPVPREVIWGGTKLKEKYGKKAPFDRIAESWELTVRKDAVCRIDGGTYDGMLLSDYLAAAGLDDVSPDWNGVHFPLLIKWIDAGDDLSVQVHPDDEYAHLHENDSGKTELWYVAEAEPGARIIYGLLPGVSKTDFQRFLREDPAHLSALLRSVPVHAGDVYFIPAGQVHALGRGIVVAEIQQNADITYRIDDYGRRQKDGSMRELHLDKAKDVVCPRSDAEVRALQFARGNDENTLASCYAFRVRRYTAADMPVPLNVAEESFATLLCTDGIGEIKHEGDIYAVQKGDCFFIPAGTGNVTLRGAIDVLITTL